MSVLLPVIYIRAIYARWALQYVPPLIDGVFNPDYQKLSDYANDERLVEYFRNER